MILRPLKPCNPSSSVGRSDPQCVSPQQKAAKQPLDEPQEPTRLLQELLSKPQRQSVAPKRSQASQPKHSGKIATWNPTDGRSPYFDMQHTSKPGFSKVKSEDKKQPSTKEINHSLVDASSPEQVLRIYAQHRERFNIINISTALHRIAKVPLWMCLPWLHMALHEGLLPLQCTSSTTGPSPLLQQERSQSLDVSCICVTAQQIVCAIHQLHALQHTETLMNQSAITCIPWQAFRWCPAWWPGVNNLDRLVPLLDSLLNDDTWCT